MKSHKFAWIVNKQPNERTKGMTINLYQNTIETESRKVTLFNTPSTHNYMKATILGINQSDCALLVVSSCAAEL